MGHLIDRDTFETGICEGRYVIQPGQVLSPTALELAREQGVEILRADLSSRARSNNSTDLSARISQRFEHSGVQPDPALIETVRREVEAMAQKQQQASGDEPTNPEPQSGSPQLLSCLNCDAYRGQQQKRIVVTSAGRNRSGIVARIAVALAECQVDIVDLSQTLVGEFFTMIIVADISAAARPFESIRESLLSAGQDLGVHVAVMNDELLRSMHRV